MAGSTAPRVALLRGINVGGRGMVKMSRLIEVLTSHGYLDVITHLQSGNVIFSEPGSGSVDPANRCRMHFGRSPWE